MAYGIGMRIADSIGKLFPVIVHPNQKQVLPLAPLFIKNEDGQNKQDCEINAAKRWVLANKEFLTRHKVILLGDDLFSRVPFIDLIQTIPDVDYVFVAKPSSHSYLYQWIEDLDSKNEISHVVQEKAFASHDHHYILVNAVPLNGGEKPPIASFLDMLVFNKK